MITVITNINYFFKKCIEYKNSDIHLYTVIKTYENLIKSTGSVYWDMCHLDQYSKLFRNCH